MEGQHFFFTLILIPQTSRATKALNAALSFFSQFLNSHQSHWPLLPTEKVVSPLHVNWCLRHFIAALALHHRCVFERNSWTNSKVEKDSIDLQHLSYLQKNSWYLHTPFTIICVSIIIQRIALNKQLKIFFMLYFFHNSITLGYIFCSCHINNGYG